MGKSSQTLRMLTNEQSLYQDNKRKMGLSYTDPCPLGQAIACHPKLYDAEVLGLHYVKSNVHDIMEILNDAEESQVKMKEKQFHFNYKRNLYDTFVPQNKLSPKQEYFLDPSISSESESSKEMSDLPIPKMPNKSKLLKLFEKMDNAIWALRERIDKTLLKDTQRRWMSDSQNELREFYKTDVILMSVSLSKSSKELQQELTEEVQEILMWKLRTKKRLNGFQKESKDGDKFCNDVIEVKEKLSNQIVQIEKDFSKLEA
ncbi:hypothetical protein Tco_1478854 [Tanacetum coccineum]